MNIRGLAATIAMTGALGILPSCSAGHSPEATIHSGIDSALAAAEARLETGNIDVDGGGSSGLPRAQITPQGDFVVAGNTVPTTPDQRAELLEYRKQLLAVAAEGIAIGKQGAALGLHAAGTALAAVLSGKSEHEVEQDVEAQASGIKQAAAKLCDRLPGLRAEQQKLAAILPAFKPYARMTQADIDDCRDDALKNDDAERAQIRESIRDRIRSGIRSGIQVAAQGSGLASSETNDSGSAAEAASTGKH